MGVNRFSGIPSGQIISETCVRNSSKVIAMRHQSEGGGRLPMRGLAGAGGGAGLPVSIVVLPGKGGGPGGLLGGSTAATAARDVMVSWRGPPVISSRHGAGADAGDVCFFFENAAYSDSSISDMPPRFSAMRMLKALR